MDVKHLTLLGYIGSQNSTVTKKNLMSQKSPLKINQKTPPGSFTSGEIFRWVGIRRCFPIDVFSLVQWVSSFITAVELQVFMAYLLLQPVVFRWLHCEHNYHSK